MRFRGILWTGLVVGCLVTFGGPLATQGEDGPDGSITIQQELDRRQKSLSRFLQSRDEQERIRLLEEIRVVERRLLGQGLPAELRIQLLDEHVGLLTHLAGHFQWQDPQRERQLREEIVEVRRVLHPQPGDWRVAMARAEWMAAARAVEVAQTRAADLLRIRQRTQQALESVEQGKFAEAAPVLGEVATDLESLLGGDCLPTGQVRRMLGQVLLEQELGLEAATASLQAARIVNQAVGKCPLLVGALGDCASGLHLAGETARAVGLQRQAAAVAEEIFGKESSEYATQINNLAYFMSETGDIPAALALVRQAGEVYATLGEQRSIADNANLTGTLSMKAGQHLEALRAFQRAAELQSELKGPRHLHVAVAWGNASQAALQLGRLRDADRYIAQAMVIIDDTVGRNDPQIADLLIQFASVRREQRRMKEADPMMEQACRLLRERYGENHPAYALASLNLAAMRFEQGRYDQAEDILLKAAAVFNSKLGSRSWALGATLTRLAQVQARKQQGDLARDALNVAGQIALEALDQRHPELADHLRQVAEVHRDLQDDGLAVAALNQAVRITEDRLGDRHPEFATALVSLGRILVETPEQERGAELIRQGTGILVESLGREHPEVLRAALEVARMRRLMNQPAEALRELSGLDEMVKQELGQENGFYADLLLETGKNLLRTGDLKTAEARLLDAGLIFAEQYGEQHPQAREAMALIAAARSGDAARITDAAIHRLHREAMTRVEAVGGETGAEATMRTQRVAELMRRLAL